MKEAIVTIMCRNDELSWLLLKDLELFNLITQNSQILLKIRKNSLTLGMVGQKSSKIIGHHLWMILKVLSFRVGFVSCECNFAPPATLKSVNG